jgi:hypothetical protein
MMIQAKLTLMMRLAAPDRIYWVKFLMKIGEMAIKLVGDVRMELVRVFAPVVAENYDHA